MNDWEAVQRTVYSVVQMRFKRIFYIKWNSDYHCNNLGGEVWNLEVCMQMSISLSMYDARYLFFYNPLQSYRFLLILITTTNRCWLSFMNFDF